MNMTASEIYGTAPVFIGAVPNQTAMSATDNVPAGLRGLIDPKNPLVWFAGILLVTVGAAGFATSARIGPIKVSGSLGKG